MPNLICKYSKKNGWLYLAPIEDKFRQLSKDWYIKMSDEFQKNKIEAIKKSENLFIAGKTKIKIEDYRINIESTDLA